MEFSVRAFFTSREDVSEDMNSFMKNQMDTMFVDYFKNVDMTKFREDIDPKEILNMLLWLTDGYLHQRMFYTDTVDADELMRQFRKMVRNAEADRIQRRVSNRNGWKEAKNERD